jgi:GTP-binding protein
MFADRAKIIIRSGKGGDGHVSFRREKFVPDGGPDGGDGGKGGDVIFEVDNNTNTLMAYRHHRKYSATDGEAGRKKRQHGADGEDIVLRVPEGTVVKLASTGEVIADLSGENRRQIVLKGGRGGNGNMHYATSTMQAPTYAQPGQEARELEVALELKLIADVGLIGYPNVGKSTLLSRISNASPKIADYHFTTLEPNLGVVDLGDGEGFVVADIPGLIEGASQGAGLGHEFLRHIERCKILVHVVDAASVEGRDPVEDIYRIDEELAAYNVSLEKKPQIIAANKCDAVYSQDLDPASRIRAEFGPKGVKVFAISAATGQGLKELLYAVYDMLQTVPKEVEVFAQEYFPEDHIPGNNLPYQVWRDEEDAHLFHVEGPKVEKMLGYTNLDSEKGFRFFQNFLKDTGILKDLEKLGVEDGDTVKLYGLQFEYFR